jgi:hypothetical protein
MHCSILNLITLRLISRRTRKPAENCSLCFFICGNQFSGSTWQRFTFRVMEYPGSCCKIAVEWKHQNRAPPVSLNVNSASDQFIRLINACLLSRSPAGIASRAESARRGQQQKTPPPRPAALCGARQIFALAYYLMPTGNWTRPVFAAGTQKIARAAGISI